MGPSKLIVGQTLKERIEYAALTLAHYPSVSSWCRAVALQAIQAQQDGTPPPATPKHDPSEPLDQKIRIYDLTLAEKEQIETAAGELGLSPWLRAWVEAEVARLETAAAKRPVAVFQRQPSRAASGSA